jgi:hypothetical protein
MFLALAKLAVITIQSHDWKLISDIYFFVLGLLGLVGIILWKKRGVYLIVATSLLNLICDQIISMQRSMFLYLILMLPIVLLVIAVARKWPAFEVRIT